MALVSVIVPVYKVEDYLEQCVQSICTQTYRELEIILVDDGSPDRCGAMCEEYAGSDDRIVVVHKENGGLGDARNTGIGHAHGEYLLFIDSDDWIHENLVQEAVDKAEKNEADIVVFDYASVEPDGIRTDIFTMDIPVEKVLSAEAEPRLVMKSCSAVNKLYRKSFWDSAGLLFTKGRYYEDLGTIPKIMVLAQRIVYTKKVLYYYRMREGSIMHSSDFKRNYEDRTTVIDGVFSFFKEKGLWEQYQNELEYLAFENAYFVPSKEIVLNDRKSEYLEKFRNYAHDRFPQLDNNPYIRELSKKDKVLRYLLDKKMYRTMIFMSYARRIKDRYIAK